MRRVVFLLFILSFTACNREKVLEETRFAMGTYVRIKVWGTSERLLQDALKESFNEIARVENLTSHFKDESGVSVINKKDEVVSAELARLLEKTLEVSRTSGGMFDPTIFPLLELWGFYDSTGSERRVPSKEEVASALRHVDYGKIEIRGDTIRLLVGFKKSGKAQVRVKGWGMDLSGIAKGYAVDAAVKVLKDRGITQGLVDAGGDIFCFGAKKDGWNIGIRNPRGEGLISIVKIDSGAIATSGDYENYFEKDGIRYHHLMDPRTGMPARGQTSATVIAPSATGADAWATTLFVMGKEGIRLLDSLGTIQGMLIAEDGSILKTKGFPPLEEP